MILFPVPPTSMNTQNKDGPESRKEIKLNYDNQGFNETDVQFTSDY